jgi:hypothetical protein
MPQEDIPSMLQVIEEKIASSKIEVHRGHGANRKRRGDCEDRRSVPTHLQYP